MRDYGGLGCIRIINMGQQDNTWLKKVYDLYGLRSRVKVGSVSEWPICWGVKHDLRISVSGKIVMVILL